MTHTNETIGRLDTVALLEDIPEHKLLRGNVGTVVEELSGKAYMVEFVDNDGETYGLVPLRASQLIVLRHESGRVA